LDRAKASIRAIKALSNCVEPRFNANKDTTELESIISSKGRSIRATTKVPNKPLLYP